MPIVDGEPYNRNDVDWAAMSHTAWRLARRCVSDPAEAEELAQHALVQLLIQIETEQSVDQAASAIRHPVAWLDRVIRNRAAKQARRRELERQAHEAWHANRACVTLSEAPQRLLAGQALAPLSARERELLVLSAQGHTQREIAERLGCSTQSVGVRVQRARHKARRVA